MIHRQPLTCCRLLTSTRSPTKTAAPCSTRPIQNWRIQETACYIRRLSWTARSLESGSGRSRKTLLQFLRTTSRNSSGLRLTPSTRLPTAMENSLVVVLDQHSKQCLFTAEAQRPQRQHRDERKI